MGWFSSAFFFLLLLVDQMEDAARTYLLNEALACY